MEHGAGNINKDEVLKALKEILEEMGLDIENIDSQAFVRSVISTVNHMSLGVRVNANTTIFAGTAKISNMYGEVLAKTIENWFPDSVAVTGESSIYNYQNWNAKQKAFKIVLVRNYEGQSLEKLFNSLFSFEQDGFNPTVLLCTTEKVFEKMRRYEKNEYRLFYSLCGNKIIIPDN